MFRFLRKQSFFQELKNKNNLILWCDSGTHFKNKVRNGLNYIFRISQAVSVSLLWRGMLLPLLDLFNVLNSKIFSRIWYSIINKVMNFITIHRSAPILRGSVSAQILNHNREHRNDIYRSVPFKFPWFPRFLSTLLMSKFKKFV